MPAAITVQSLGSLRDWTPDWVPRSLYGSVRFTDDLIQDYATIYRTQPNVRTVVDFLARNIAQLGLHTFRRVSDLDRVRLTDHPLAALIKRPNPWTTTYRLIHALVSDMAIYDQGFWLPTREAERLSLLRVPPVLVTVKGTGIGPTGYEIDLGPGKPKITPAPDEIVHFRGYSPTDGFTGVSPMETLRRILSEEQAAGDYREHFWRNSARMSGVIERPADAPEWSEVAKQRFAAEWAAIHSGAENSGKTGILEEGMTWKAGTFSADQSQYLEGRKLTREEVARAYHVPLPMVGILDHATFSNITEQHKNLYQDTLGPWLAMMEQEIALQMLPWFTEEEQRDVYVEFNIQEKLQGSFEEQVKTFQSAVGRPYMTPAEARARLNFPRLDDPTADQLAIPLNVLIGGQASPQDSAPPADGAPKLWLPGDAKATPERFDPTRRVLRERHREKWRQVLVNFFQRQARAVESAYGGKVRTKDGPGVDDLFAMPRWSGELQADLFRLFRSTALNWAQHVAEAFGGELDEDRLDNYIDTVTNNAAVNVNKTTRAGLEEALGADDPREAIRHVFEVADSRAVQIAQTLVSRAANFGSHEGAKQSGVLTKMWQVNSGNPRSQHAALSGEVAAIGENFSNGMRWPADTGAGVGPEDIANCECSVVFERSSR